jgi:flavin reductase (DIM6/NTAB) family NADH-FMN oxidoreductase RutF
MGSFISGVTIVSTIWQDAAHAMTATAFSSVSLDPPLVLVCVS